MESAKLGGKFRIRELKTSGSLSFAVIHIAAKITIDEQIPLASRIWIFIFIQHSDNTATHTYPLYGMYNINPSPICLPLL